MRLVILGLLSILAAAWFGLSFVHSAWMSATPVPDPTPYERHAIMYLALTTGCVFVTLTTFTLAWLRRGRGRESNNET